jgi:hypothetical protein
MEMLRRGQKAIERQEWEKGETASEWYFAAGKRYRSPTRGSSKTTRRRA